MDAENHLSTDYFDEQVLDRLKRLYARMPNCNSRHTIAETIEYLGKSYTSTHSPWFIGYLLDALDDAFPEQRQT